MKSETKTFLRLKYTPIKLSPNALASTLNFDILYEIERNYKLTVSKYEISKWSHGAHYISFDDENSDKDVYENRKYLYVFPENTDERERKQIAKDFFELLKGK